MKYIQEFRDKNKIIKTLELINKTSNPKQHYRIMEFCGGHTHVLHRFSLLSLLPPNIDMIHGPGCPVCVLPTSDIDYAIAVAQQPNIIFCSYADMLRVPGTKQQTLNKAKAKGANIKMVYSVIDALNIAQNNPSKQVIFFAIGFETTTPPTAYALLQAKKLGLKNFTVLCKHVLTPPAMAALLSQESSQTQQIHGFLGPAHVSIVIGTKGYQDLAKQYQKPIVISGFEPLDMLQSIQMCVAQINNQNWGIINQYKRAVKTEGTPKAQTLIKKTLSLREKSEWRGLGYIPNSSLKIAKDFRDYDAEIRFPISLQPSKEHKACDCGKILRGLKKPHQCKLFGIACTPEQPLGACMVSSEGACAAAYTYNIIKRPDFA